MMQKYLPSLGLFSFMNEQQQQQQHDNGVSMMKHYSVRPMACMQVYKYKYGIKARATYRNARYA